MIDVKMSYHRLRITMKFILQKLNIGTNEIVSKYMLWLFMPMSLCLPVINRTHCNCESKS